MIFKPSMLLKEIAVYCVVIFLVNGECPFPLTNQTLNHTCDWSNWLPWNCTMCCGSDVITQELAFRLRGICCNNSQPLDDCLTKCGFNRSDDTEYGRCNTSCPNITSTSLCPMSTTYVTLPTTQAMDTTVASTTLNAFSGSSTNATPTHVVISPLKNSTSSHVERDTSSIPTTVGVVCGSLAAACLLALTIVLCLKKKNMQKRIDPDKVPSADN